MVRSLTLKLARVVVMCAVTGIVNGQNVLPAPRCHAPNVIVEDAVGTTCNGILSGYENKMSSSKLNHATIAGGAYNEIKAGQSGFIAGEKNTIHVGNRNAILGYKGNAHHSQSMVLAFNGGAGCSSTRDNSVRICADSLQFNNRDLPAELDEKATKASLDTVKQEASKTGSELATVRDRVSELEQQVSAVKLKAYKTAGEHVIEKERTTNLTEEVATLREELDRKEAKILDLIRNLTDSIAKPCLTDGTPALRRGLMDCPPPTSSPTTAHPTSSPTLEGETSVVGATLSRLGWPPDDITAIYKANIHTPKQACEVSKTTLENIIGGRASEFRDLYPSCDQWTTAAMVATGIAAASTIIALIALIVAGVQCRRDGKKRKIEQGTVKRDLDQERGRASSTKPISAGSNGLTTEGKKPGQGKEPDPEVFDGKDHEQQEGKGKQNPDDEGPGLVYG